MSHLTELYPLQTQTVNEFELLIVFDVLDQISPNIKIYRNQSVGGRDRKESVSRYDNICKVKWESGKRKKVRKITE